MYEWREILQAEGQDPSARFSSFKFLQIRTSGGPKWANATWSGPNASLRLALSLNASPRVALGPERHS